MPVWSSLLSGTSASSLNEQVAQLRSRIGEGQFVKTGFTLYIALKMSSWTVDPTDRAAIRAAMAGTISDIDTMIAKAKAAGIPIAMAILNSRIDDAAQQASAVEDRRNVQWYSDHAVAKGTNNTKLFWSVSRYARKQQRLQEAYVRELGRVLAERMRLNPDTLLFAAGDGEVELANPAEGADALLADYSPFTVAEFRDWLRNGGLYATGQPYAGEGYSLSARYTGDASPGTDTNGDGHTLNGDFGTSFTTWNLKFFDWDVTQAVGNDGVIPSSTYNGPVTSFATGFDAPRARSLTGLTGAAKDFAQVWRDFREAMIARHNRLFSQWITDSADDNGAKVPSTRWFSYQIAADYLFGLTRGPNQNARLETSASTFGSADVSPYGGIGITSFNLVYGGIPGAPGGLLTFRTLNAVVPEFAKRNVRWALMEWHPCLNGNNDPTVTTDVLLGVCREENDLIAQYRPNLLAPFAWQLATSPIENAPFETSLRELVARLNLGRQAAAQLKIDAPAANASLPGAFTISGYAVDLGNRGPGRGTGIDRVRVSAVPTGGGAAVDLGLAQYGLTRSDVGTSLGTQFTPSGFSLAVAGGALTAGKQYRLDVFGRSTVTGVDAVTQSVTITVAAPTPEPHLGIDTPVNGSSILQGATFNVSGWVLDKGAASGIGIDNVAIYAGPTFLGFATLGGSRTDIGTLFGTQFNNSGFTLSVTNSLAPGTYQIAAFGHSTVTNTFSAVSATNITITPVVSRPTVSLDAPNSNVTVGRNVKIAGWAIDQGAAGGTGVDGVVVYTFPNDGSAPQFLGAATYGVARSDIGAAIGSRFTNSGFRMTATITPPGTYRIVAFAHSTVTNSYSAAATATNVAVQATDSNATIYIDTPGPNTTVTRPFTISGWTVDEGATTGTGVDLVALWAFPTNGTPATLVGLATYGLVRPDIGSLLGDSRFSNSGFSMTVNSSNLPTAGAYDLIVFGHSTVTNAYTIAKVVRVTVQ